MKKLIAMIGAAVMSFGLFATQDPSVLFQTHRYTVPTDFEVGPTNIVGYTDDAQTSFFDVTDDESILWWGANFPTNEAELTSYEQPAEVANGDVLDETGVNYLKIEADTAAPMLRMLGKVTPGDEVGGEGTGIYSPTITPYDIGNLGIFIDTKVQLSASEEAPQDFDGKVAVWLHVVPEEKDDQGNVIVEGSTNLMVTCGQLDNMYAVADQPTNIAITAEGVDVKPDTWYRVTIRSIQTIATGKTVAGFVIFINGKLATVAEGASYVIPSTGLTDKAKEFNNQRALFASASTDDATAQTLESVGFAGNGGLRTINVTDAYDAPLFAQDPTEVLITWDEHVDSITINEIDITKLEGVSNNSIMYKVTGFSAKSAAVEAEVTYKENYRGKSITDTSTADPTVLVDFEAEEDKSAFSFSIGQFAQNGAVTVVSELDRDEALVTVDGVALPAYPSLETALAEINSTYKDANNIKIVLGEDVATVSSVNCLKNVKNKDVLIDLAGKTIQFTATDTTAYAIWNNSNLTITNSAAAVGMMESVNGVKLITNQKILTIVDANMVFGGKVDNNCSYLAPDWMAATVNLFGGKYTSKVMTEVNDAEDPTVKPQGWEDHVEDGINLGTQTEPLKWVAPVDPAIYWTLVSDKVITFTVEQVENVTAVVTVDGKVVEGSGNTYTAKPDLEVEVTYNANEGYVFSDKTTSVTLPKETSAQDLEITAPAQVKAVAKAQAKKGTVLFLTLQDAIDADGADPVVLLEDVELTARIDIAKALTLDLGGYTIKSTAAGYAATSFLLKVLDGADVTISNGAVNATIPTTASKPNCGIWLEGATLALVDVDVVAAAKAVQVTKTSTLNVDADSLVKSIGNDTALFINTQNGDETIKNPSTVTIAGMVQNAYDVWPASASGRYAYAVSGNGNDKAGANLTIANGATISSANMTAIYFPCSGSLTINAATVTGTEGVYVKAGTTAVVNGATISATLTSDKVEAYTAKGDGFANTGDAFVVDNCDYPSGDPTVTISGGTFTSVAGAAIASYAKEGKTALAHFVSGGAFKGAVDPDDVLVAETATTIGSFVDGTGALEGFKVPTTVAAVATVNGAKFATAAEALAAVQALEVGDNYVINVAVIATTLEVTDPTGTQQIVLAAGDTIKITKGSWEFNNGVTITAGKPIALAEGAVFTVTTQIANYESLFTAPAGFKVIEVAGTGVYTYTTEELPTIPWEGGGTEDDPYQIATYDDLVALQAWVAAGKTTAGVYFKQMGNIDMSATAAEGWVGIGTLECRTDVAATFKGVYDGDNKEITNLTFSGKDYNGLFASAYGATIKNLKVAVSGIKGGGAAAFVGCAENCQLSNLTSSGNIGTEAAPGTHICAGIAVRFQGSTANACTNKCEIWSNKGKLGGLFGIGQGATPDYINNCSNEGEIHNLKATLDGDCGVGGIFGVGYHTQPQKIYIDNCTSKAAIYSADTTSTFKQSRVGSMVGRAEGDVVYFSGKNITLDDMRVVGSHDCGITYGKSIDNGLVELCAASDFAAGETYKTMKSGLTLAFTLAAANDTIAFNTNLYAAVAFNVTPGEHLEVAETAAGGIVTFTATAIPQFDVTFSKDGAPIVGSDTKVYRGESPTDKQIPEITDEGAWDVNPTNAVITCNTNFNFTVKAGGIEPGKDDPTEYTDENAAKEAAEKATVAVPEDVKKADVDEAEYKALFAGKVVEVSPGVFHVKMDFAAATVEAIQPGVDSAEADIVADIADQTATTITATIPAASVKAGLYYGIVAVGELDAFTTAKPASMKMATQTGVVLELAPVDKDTTATKGFYKTVCSPVDLSKAN